MVWISFPSVESGERQQAPANKSQMLPTFRKYPSRNTALTLHDESNTFRDIGRTCLRLWILLSRDDEVRDFASSD